MASWVTDWEQEKNLFYNGRNSPALDPKLIWTVVTLVVSLIVVTVVRLASQHALPQQSELV